MGALRAKRGSLSDRVPITQRRCKRGFPPVHPLSHCMKHHCIPNASRFLAAILALAFTAAAWSHPVPDLPVRSHFAADGSAEIRIEVDPRGFSADPESINYFQKGAIESLPADKVQQMKETADVFVGQRLRFVFDPIGEMKPKLVWEFKKLGDGGIPFETDDASLLKGDETVLVGSWKTKVVAGMTGFRIEALALTPEKMGAPLNVMFINFIGGKRVERYRRPPTAAIQSSNFGRRPVSRRKPAATPRRARPPT